MWLLSANICTINGKLDGDIHISQNLLGIALGRTSRWLDVYTELVKLFQFSPNEKQC